MSGGFGRMQWLILIFAVIAYQGINIFVYNMAFLELMPKLMCRDNLEGEFHTCIETRDICQGNSLIDRGLWMIDFTDDQSFHNWMTDLELFWESDFAIGMIGASFFIGSTLYGFILTFNNVIGRKKFIIIGMVCQIVCVYGLFYASSLNVIYIFLFLSGLWVAKNICIYIYVMEWIPTNYQLIVGAVLNAWDVVTVVLPVSIYFYFGGANWSNIFFPVLIIPVFGFLLSFSISESPRFLIAKWRFDEAREVIQMYATVNGIKIDHEYLIEGESNGRQSENTIGNIFLIFLNFINTWHNWDLDQNEDLLQTKGSKNKEFSLIEVLKEPANMINLIVVIMCFVFVSFNYYMVNFFMKYVGGNIFINTLLSSISESIGNFAVSPIHKYSNTKVSFMVMFGCSWLVALPLLVSKSSVIVAVSVFSCKFFIEGAFMMAYFVNAEVFPPLLVPFSFSIWGIMSKIATIGAPVAAEIKPRQVPIILLCVFSAIACGCVTLLRIPKSTKPKHKSS